MSHPREHRVTRLPGRELWKRLLSPFGAVIGALAVMALIYLGHDLVKGKISPCESIFQETSVGLSTRIKFLKTEGELQIGREAVTELDERAQMAALNLKTCCTVLDAGRIDPEQFLQCKAKARAYDARVDDIVALVRTAVKEGIAGAPGAEPAMGEQPSTKVSASIGERIEAARTVSREFNREVVEVRKEQALQSLQAVAPDHVEVAAQEREPNDDPLSTNIIGLDKWVTGSVAAQKDSDFYSFTTPEAHRDWMRIEFQNQSTTLEPNLELFDAEKSSIGSVHNATKGSDLVYAFVAPPKARYAVRVSNFYGQSVGVYLIRVLATKAYDAYEPNDDILNAKRISEGTSIKAQIMDSNDVDFFSIEGGDRENQMVVTIANNSTPLHPNVAIFDASKTEVGNQHNATAGGDVTYTFKAQSGAVYVRVSDYYSNGAGDYTLTVIRQ